MRVTLVVAHGLLTAAAFLSGVAFLTVEHGSRHKGSVVVAHVLSCPKACGIFPDQGSNPHLPHCKADS